MTDMKLRLIAASIAALLYWQPAHAGRPFATDDAGTAPVGTCLLESWGERAGRDKAFVIAPACGVVEGLEVGVDLHPPESARRGPRGRRPGGEDRARVVVSGHPRPAIWALGLKLGVAHERPAGKGWRHNDAYALVLATLSPAEHWTIHANLGAARNRPESGTGALLNLAVGWTPIEPLLLFGEVQLNNRRELFGGTVHTAGARWWLIPEKLGLDLTGSRENGVGSTLWTFGIGWYDITF